MHRIDVALHLIAEKQLGLVTRTQVLAAGGTDKSIKWYLDAHRWQQLQPGVYLTGSSPPTWLQRQLAACLAAGPGATASHRAAAAIWRLDGAEEGPIELTVVGTEHARPRRAVLHRTRRWDEIDRRLRRGVPVTSVNRTLVDYGAHVPKILVERAVEDAFRRHLTTEGVLRRRLGALGGPGRRGAGVLRTVLDRRPEGTPARSGFEVMLLDVTREYGLPMPYRHHVVRVNGIPIAEIDLSYVRQLVALEANGARWHSTVRARKRDEERIAMLRALGWNVEEFTWDEVVNHPALVAQRIATALRVAA
jgi:hypothetical protein